TLVSRDQRLRRSRHSRLRGCAPSMPVVWWLRPALSTCTSTARTRVAKGLRPLTEELLRLSWRSGGLTFPPFCVSTRARRSLITGHQPAMSPPERKYSMRPCKVPRSFRSLDPQPIRQLVPSKYVPSRHSWRSKLPRALWALEWDCNTRRAPLAQKSFMFLG